jgi:uncharacterized protein (UPF0333 family)
VWINGGTAMDLLASVWAWLIGKLHPADQGQGSIEYVLLILGCVLFLVAAAILLQNVLGGAVTAISSWANSVGAP